MKIAFFGLPLGALCLLRDGRDVQLAVLSPVPAPGARRLSAALPPESVLRVAEFEAEALRTQIDELLATQKPDLIVSWYFTRRIEAAWLEYARLGGIGVHPSLLPRHRGPNPFFWAIDGGDEVTGVSVHWLVDTYDAGDVIAQRSIPVGQHDAWQLARALDRVSLQALRESVSRLAQGEKVVSTAQDEAQVSWAPEPEGAALRLDPTWGLERALRRIRALAPVPGLPVAIRGMEIFVTRASVAHAAPQLIAGEAAVWPGSESPVTLAVADGALRVDRAVVAETGEELDGPTLAARLGILPPDPA
jgi:methionyl-tRNA formyltransferase